MSVLESIYLDVCIYDMMSMCWNVHPTVNPKIFYIKTYAVSEKKLLIQIYDHGALIHFPIVAGDYDRLTMVYYKYPLRVV